MYFISEQDPNYTVKGSRDPLGFQVIWQEAGKRLIPYLSTVSGTLKDFQVICIAYALKKELQITDADFESYFIRLEQLMAYTRFQLNQNDGFNGIDKVRKIMTEGSMTVKISNATSDQILSNQRAYGIWGKYIRPFTDIGFVKTPEFEDIFCKKINANGAFLKQAILLKKKTTTDVAYINTDKLNSFYSLLDKPSTEEKQLFTVKLLQDNCNNELLRLCYADQSITKLPFYELLDKLCASSANTNFIATLQYIKNTEKIISPLNHIFRYLQTRSYWKIEEIANDEYISNWRNEPDTTGFGEVSKSLAALLKLSNVELVKGLVIRNEEVSNRRNSAAWLRLTASGIEVNHFEGGFLWEDYNPEINNDNNYFISTFISLLHQLN